MDKIGGQYNPFWSFIWVDGHSINPTLKDQNMFLKGIKMFKKNDHKMIDVRENKIKKERNY